MVILYSAILHMSISVGIWI